MTPTRRRTDQSRLARLDEVLKRYGIFWLPLLWLAGSLGFSLITPKITANQLKALIDSSTKYLQIQIDTNREQSRRQDAAIMQVHVTLTSQMKMLLLHDCLDKYMPLREKQLIGLPCADLLREAQP